MDVTKLNNEGWKSQISLNKGIQITYDWFLKNLNNYKKIKFK